ncbi:uncharacterized protein LOC125588485 [Brassica napus]|uniref:uncharacterized protein LOC125588485 n=1 Tax=Brassica napus TaxID=3708 RepID=UPI00207A4D99|nr:uncharacterized protein LOC125588485 [Brassica napus]
MLRLCGEVVTEEELLEKTYSTFYSSNVIPQQQYRMKGFATYTDLISRLLLAEANNELLLKNSEARPVGTTPLPEANEVEKKEPNECNYVQNNKRSYGNGRGGYKGRGSDNSLQENSESLKNKNPEAHMVHDSGYEADNDSDIAKDDQMDFETSESLKD